MFAKAVGGKADADRGMRFGSREAQTQLLSLCSRALLDLDGERRRTLALFGSTG